MLVEICVQSLEDALMAEQEGADRIELCAALETGGLTPSAGCIQRVLDRVNIPVHVLVRPRTGNFIYTDLEYQAMLLDIQLLKEWGAHGIVTGILNQDGHMDIKRMSRIRDASEDMHLTFHRAFDLVAEPTKAISELEALNVNTVLTSGQQKHAGNAIPVLLDLKERANRVTIMPGGGIRPENILQFKNAEFDAIHFSATKPVPEAEGISNSDRFSVSDLGSTPCLKMQPEMLHQMIRSVK